MDAAVLERVRKLLALATSDNPHEAAGAAARAQALIAEHRLQRWLDEEERDPITDGADEPLEVGRKARKWKRVLASVLAEANGCRAWVLERGRREQSLCVAGRAEDREAVRALWDLLVKRIEWLSATEGAGRDRGWHEAFRIGVVDAIATRLRDEKPAAGEAALVLVGAHEAALEAFMDERFGPGTGKALRVDAAGWEAGKRAGRDFEL